MDFLEKVERLRTKANISYEEAKTILSQTDGDLLEAMILLEKQGKLTPPAFENQESSYGRGNAGEAHYNSHHSNGQDAWKGFCRWLKSLFVRGNRNNLQIKKGENVIAAMPVTVFAAALIFAFWISVPLLIVGLFCGCSYSFVGPDLEKETINKAWDKASQMAETIKEDIKKEMDGDKESK